MGALQPALGIGVLLLIAWSFSENRRAVSLKRVATGLGITFLLAVLLLKIGPVRAVLASAYAAVDVIAAASRAGTAFVFGYVGGGPLPFELKYPGNEFVLALQALPIVLLMSVLTSLLYYWRILPPIVRGFAWVLERIMGIGGAVGLSTAANVFVGMIEAPLLIRPYLDRLSRSELFLMMTVGMAGIAGTVLVLYATIVGPVVPGATGHFITASVLGAMAAIVISQIMVPETADHRTGGSLDQPEAVAASTMDAIVKGTGAGLELLLNIAAMLVVLVALVSLANAILAILPHLGGQPITLQRALGYVMAPICWLIGVPWSEAATAGSLMGIKTVLNEFIAFLQLAALPPGALSPRSRLIMLYAMCGFANFGSLGILIGGLTTMAPSRREEVVSLGLRSIVSGTLSTCLIGAIVGILG